jgi:hypothetical protein
MNENSSTNYVTNARAAWTKVGEAVDHATELYLTELSSYLDWARDFQRELLAQSVITAQEISRFGEKQLAFVARIRESVPAVGIVPKGTETVAGMVEAIVQETEPKA